ncbi:MULTISPECIES: DNA gyrase subunit A [Commensalibacter]|uniref:DNA gyrase subunit A n=2 Tax=Commensalibacter TaxID=1079922 RepID=W7DMH4_9PROT|nr:MULTISPECIES: DNA gyrase subunit A [Commensalibacter]EUK18517.1 DNA gyrase subunit A [Commensalibacter papalotli (ex Servin-Garciduenas et al. 2014)]CAI3932409.1 DNA gyrase/topoisomerase IV [Commensalibacter papalotli (ex Botero et al. 2024)]CAI3943249.1 DNA gyrase/topoisomerase IV [Commensalibacter papalotli (ex Botero et al. 2024)]
MTDLPENTLPTSLTDIVPVTVEEEMQTSYLAYAMSVIVSRALPDVRDGLKPVHRRILYSMFESGLTADKPYRKSARAVGDVMSKYHPHGDSSIYDAMVRMAQHWSMRVRLVDGQGNFGSVDGDSPAAMRYTEARLGKPATFLLEDINQDTVDFQANYDETEEEPVILPATYPNLLINGASGIAVGMATNIPTHNPTEIIDATLALIENPEMDLPELMQIVTGPDFPTGGIILGRSGIRSAYATGRGSVLIRGRANIEEIRKDRQAIIITEIPYQVNKATLQEKIAELVRAKQIEGVSDIRDESDRSGMRIVIEIKRDATPDVVLNQLYRFTQLQTSFGVNMLALNNGKPQLLGLKDALTAFISFREEVILRRARFELNKARDRAHLLLGLMLAVANIDEVIALIRSAPDSATAREQLMQRSWPAADIQSYLDLIQDDGNILADGRVYLSETQVRGILELRLQRLTGLEREKIQSELIEVSKRIEELLAIIASHIRRMEIMRDELLRVRGEIGCPRATEIVDYEGDQTDESLIEPGQMVVTITRDGFIKRTSLETFRSQNRGGRGRKGAGRRGDDIITRSFNAHTHQWVIFFSSGGKAYRVKVWHLPEASPTSKGRALVNLLPDLGGDEITAVLPLPQDEEMWPNLHLVFATSKGGVRRNRLSDFGNIRSSGLIAMKLDENERLIGVATCREGQDIFLASKKGRAVRFQITDDTVRVFAGRASTGVRGIRLADDDEVMSMCVLNHVDASVAERTAYIRYSNAKRRAENADVAEDIEEVFEVEEEDGSSDTELTTERLSELQHAEEILLTVTNAGFGKRSTAYDYRVSGRGGLGLSNMNLAGRNGTEIVATFAVLDNTDVMLVTDKGRLIRVPVNQVRITSRTSMGVTLFRIDDGETVSSVFPVIDDSVDEEESDSVAGQENDGAQIIE